MRPFSSVFCLVLKQRCGRLTAYLDVYIDITLFIGETVMRHAIAKLFVTGGSQAVRLPAEFRFDGTTEVYIRRDDATGDVILSRRPQRTGAHSCRCANGWALLVPMRCRGARREKKGAILSKAGRNDAVHARHQGDDAT